jgi:hypothetical protein
MKYRRSTFLLIEETYCTPKRRRLGKWLSKFLLYCSFTSICVPTGMVIV